MSFLDNFHYQMSGNEQGNKLVFLHGLMGSGTNWRRIASAFEPDFHILVYDQRGHGRSFQPARGYAPEDYAEDLKQILDELGWDHIDLVGHSLGGRNALQFAAAYPQRVRRLVIEDIGPESTLEGARRIEYLLSLVPTPFASKKEARDFLQNRFVQLLAGDPQAKVLSQFFYMNIEEQPDGSADWRFSRQGILDSLKESRAKDRWREWQDLKMPVLLVRGSESRDLSRADFERMQRENPSVEAVEIAPSGHWIHFEQPERFTQVVKNFLA